MKDEVIIDSLEFVEKVLGIPLFEWQKEWIEKRSSKVSIDCGRSRIRVVTKPRGEET